MKVRKTIKRALSMLLCVAMMMTTFDLSALTVRAGEGDMTSISGDNIVLNLRSREIIPRLWYKSLTVTTANP